MPRVIVFIDPQPINLLLPPEGVSFSLELPGGCKEAEFFVDYALGGSVDLWAPVEIYLDTGELVWSGFVGEIEFAPSGGQSKLTAYGWAARLAQLTTTTAPTGKASTFIVNEVKPALPEVVTWSVDTNDYSIAGAGGEETPQRKTLRATLDSWAAVNDYFWQITPEREFVYEPRPTNAEYLARAQDLEGRLKLKCEHYPSSIFLGYRSNSDSAPITELELTFSFDASYPTQHQLKNLSGRWSTADITAVADVLEAQMDAPAPEGELTTSRLYHLSSGELVQIPSLGRGVLIDAPGIKKLENVVKNISKIQYQNGNFKVSLGDVSPADFLLARLILLAEQREKIR